MSVYATFQDLDSASELFSWGSLTCPSRKDRSTPIFPSWKDRPAASSWLSALRATNLLGNNVVAQEDEEDGDAVQG